MPAIVLLGSASGWLSNSGFGNALVRWAGETVLHATRLGLRVSPVPSLYILLGLARSLILAEPPSDRRRTALVLFYVQLALNFAWSPIFFAGHDIRFAAIVIFVMLAVAASAGGNSSACVHWRGS